MAVEAFTSTAAAVTTGTSTFTVNPVAFHTLSRFGFFDVAVTRKGLTITKASTFGGGQSALTFPITLDAARDLLDTLRIVTT